MIRSKPATKLYRVNWDSISWPKRPKIDANEARRVFEKARLDRMKKTAEGWRRDG